MVYRGGRWLQTNKHGVHLPRESECQRSGGTCVWRRGGRRARYRHLPKSWVGPVAPHSRCRRAGRASPGGALPREGSLTEAPIAPFAPEAHARGAWGLGRPGSREGVRAGPGAPRGPGEGVAPNGFASALPLYFPWDPFSGPFSPTIRRF